MKSRNLILLLISMLLVFGVASAVSAANAPAKKPATAPANKLGSIGTAQLPGEWCEFGKAYTLGTREKGNAMNVTVKSAEYLIGHVKVGDRTFWPKEGEKLLIIRYSLHNPLQAEQTVDCQTVSWTAVDAKSENRNQEYRGVGVDDKNQNRLNQSLKPAQKIEVFAIIRVDAYGPVPKLMAAGYDAPAPVARYDLMKAKVKPLLAPYADPKDETGATVLKKIPGVLGESYITGSYESKVEKIEFAEPPLSDEGFTEGESYVLATLACKYFDEGTGGAGLDAIKLEDEDGVTYQQVWKVLHPSANRIIDPHIEYEETGKYRVVFSVPKGIQLKSLTLKEYSGLPIVIDVSEYKTPD